MNEQTLFDYAALEPEVRVTLKQRAERINERTRKIALDIWEIGRELTEAQQELAHHYRGTFQAWVESETPHSVKQAYNFMNVYRRFSCVNFTQLNLAASALYLLAAPSTPEEVRDEAIARATSGENITHSTAKAMVEATRPTLPPDPPPSTGMVYAGNGADEAVQATTPPRQQEKKEKRLERDYEDAEAIGIFNEQPIEKRYRLIHSTVASLALEENSIDVIVTDPPYPREYLPVYEDLAIQAVRCLKPGGSCFVMVGQSYLPEVLALMTKHLTYHWTLSYLTPGGQAVQLWQRKVNTFWKPVLWFVKGTYEGRWVGDVSKSAPNDNDKEFHHWGQSESGMLDLLNRCSIPGDTVLDPFCGGGATGVVAIQTGRYFIGADCDAQALQTTDERLRGIL